jgi:hypothetical protein
LSVLLCKGQVMCIILFPKRVMMRFRIQSQMPQYPLLLRLIVRQLKP